MKKILLATLLLLVTLSGCVSTAALQPDPTTPAPAAVAEDPVLTAPTQQAPKENAPARYLTQEEAIAIALADAGLAENQVSRLSAEFDYDDGIPQYDVEFKHDGWEYEYEIHAESGKILKWDKEKDD